VQSGYETDANIKPLLNEAIATDQTRLPAHQPERGTAERGGGHHVPTLAAAGGRPGRVHATTGGDCRAAAPVAQEYRLWRSSRRQRASVAFAEPPTSQLIDELA